MNGKAYEVAHVMALMIKSTINLVVWYVGFKLQSLESIYMEKLD